jgi:hypothetical protein
MAVSSSSSHLPPSGLAVSIMVVPLRAGIDTTRGFKATPGPTHLHTPYYTLAGARTPRDDTPCSWPKPSEPPINGL